MVYYPGCAEDVILRYQDIVYRIAFTSCRNIADAQDITQEVFVRYLNKTPAIVSEEHLKAWLIRVTVNVSKNLLRSAWHKTTVPFDEQETPYIEEPSGTDTYHAVLSLPEKYRSVVMLYYFEDYSVREVAHILRRTETSIQTQLQRARVMLKSKLEGEWEND